VAENATIGVLFDWDLGPAGEALAEAVRLGVADSSFKGEVRIAVAQPNGLSAGTEKEFRKGFMELVDAGVLGIVGPGITDNGFIARDLSREHRVPSIIWAAHEELRGEWSFHFQLGSLEEEPPVLLRYLAAQGLTKVAVVYDDATIIHRYVESMTVAQRFIPVEVVSRTMIDRDIVDASAAIARLRHPEAQALLYFGLGRSAEPVGLAKQAAGWQVPVVACSSLNMGRSQPQMTTSWDGWTYASMETEANPMAARARAILGDAIADSPIGYSFFDMGRFIGEGLDRAGYMTRASLKQGLQCVKHLPATVGHPGTMMTSGYWDRAVLKGPYLVLRRWQGGKTAALP
jgi:branched-chain amino acid transport system substrate-binding protein